MLTQTVKGTGEGEPLKAAETILRNLRVLATDQSTETETAENGKTVVKTFNTVTLEVTPRIAEKIAVADTLGTLNLSLRSIADNQAELEKAIASGSVKVPEGASKEEEDRILKNAMSQPGEGATTFVTGGDVSRFQRRSVPMTRDVAARTYAAAAGTAMGNAIVQSSGPGGVSPRAALYRPGPVVRVTRGKTTTEESVGGN